MFGFISKFHSGSSIGVVPHDQIILPIEGNPFYFIPVWIEGQPSRDGIHSPSAGLGSLIDQDTNKDPFHQSIFDAGSLVGSLSLKSHSQTATTSSEAASVTSQAIPVISSTWLSRISTSRNERPAKTNPGCTPL